MSSENASSSDTPSKRIYLGNLPYQAQPKDMQEFLSDAGFQIVRLDMSVDPFTGRNPSYCFAELASPEEAQRAISALSGGSFQGRPLKVNVHTPKRREEGSAGYGEGKSRIMTYERKGQATPSPLRTAQGGNDRSPYAFNRWERKDAAEHFVAPVLEEKRVYVGGLPRMDGQVLVNQEVGALFQGYEVVAISKMISPHESKRDLPGNHYYCFVEFSSKEQAAAAATLDGMESPWGGNLRINVAQARSAENNKGPGLKVIREQFPEKQWTEPVLEEKRLYVGGLPNMESQELVNQEVSSLFNDYDVEAVSKLIAPHESKRDLPGNHYYCFVDFVSKEQASAAAAKMDGSESPWGGKLRVNHGKTRGDKPRIGRDQQSDKPPVVRDFNNWRRG